MSKYIHEVKISWTKDPYGNDALAWLCANGMKPDKDWQIDMHGGSLNHTSFWFKNTTKALLFKLTLGGL